MLDIGCCRVGEEEFSLYSLWSVLFWSTFLLVVKDSFSVLDWFIGIGKGEKSGDQVQVWFISQCNKTNARMYIFCLLELAGVDTSWETICGNSGGSREGKTTEPTMVKSNSLETHATCNIQ